MRKALATVAALAVLGLASCGGSEDLGSAPDVRGLSLPTAEQQLKKSGFSADVSSDGLFGVLVEENWTVCDQSSPKGRLVPLDVSKDC